MTIRFQTFGASRRSEPSGLMVDDDVLAPMQRWQAEGRRTALVTLIGVEGGAPRHAGAQMAVAEDGAFAGYLSGGCLEQAVALEAQDVIATRRPRLLRYGKGSPYFDIKLPCGSGLDVFFDPLLSSNSLAEMIALRGARRPFALRTDLTSGASVVEAVESASPLAQSCRAGDQFSQVYAPALRVLLLGGGPMLTGMVQLAAAAGIEIAVWSPDETAISTLKTSSLGDAAFVSNANAAIDSLDFASAGILFFHDHEQEPDLLIRLLQTPCFYIGALGNHAVHRRRLVTLEALGASPKDLARIRAPVGMIPGAKSRATMAIGALAGLMAEAKALNLVA